MEILIGLVFLGASLAVAFVLPVLSYLRASRALRQGEALASDVQTLRAEIAALEIAGNKPLAMPSDCRLYAIVRRVTSTYYARRFIPFSKSAGVDVDEDLADLLFDGLAFEEA